MTNISLPCRIAFVVLIAFTPLGADAGSVHGLADSIVFIHSVQVADDDPSVQKHSYGTGFVVSDGGYVLTANHVVFQDSPGFTTQTTAAFSSRYNPAYPLMFIDNNANLDLALLMFPPNISQDFIPLTRGDSRKMKIADHLAAWGFPEGIDFTLSEGKLSAFGAQHGQWRTTMGINHGQSGAPVLNDSGEWVAVAVAGDDAKQGVTYAIPESYASPLLALVDYDTSKRVSSTALPVATHTFDYLAVAAPAGTPSGSEVQRFCLPSGYNVSAAVTTDANGEPATGRLKLSRVAGVPNCVDSSPLRSDGAGTDVIRSHIELLGTKDGLWPGAVANNQLEPASAGG